MEHLEQPGTNRFTSNTKGKSIAKNRIGKRRAWFFTLNNYTKENIGTIIKFCEIEKALYVFQEEKGSNGTHHLQGVLRFINPRSTAFQSHLTDKIHWEGCRSWKKAIDYCSKAKTRIGECFSNIHSLVPEEAVYDIIKDKGAWEWQQKVIDLIKTKPDDRSIYWFYDTGGCKGKTKLTKHLILEYDAIVVGGRVGDALFFITKRLQEKKPVKVVCFAIVRRERMNYIGMEKIKDGVCFSPKYESTMLVFNHPHVIVFANFKPEMDALSLDRWKIIEVK